MQKRIVIIGAVIFVLVIAFAGAVWMTNWKKPSTGVLPKEEKKEQGFFKKEPVAMFADAQKRLEAGESDEAARIFERLEKEYPESPQAENSLFALAELYEKNNDLVRAQESYQQLLRRFPSSGSVEQVIRKLEGINIKILFSPIKNPDSVVYEVQKGDTLGKIANQFETTINLIKRANNIQGDLIRVGQKLKITKLTFSIVVDTSQNILTLKSNMGVVKTYPVSTGINNSTPKGTFKIITRVNEPTWYKEGAVVPPGSTENILGTRWLGISEPGYGIHGSTDPGTIGKYVTAGCVRLRNEDVEELYDIVPLGTEVVIVE